MKKSSFTFGAMAGATSLAIAVPMLAQFASAATGTTDAKTNSRPVPTQACVLALAERDTAFLANVDAMIASQKAATIAHRDALTAAAALTTDADREEALKKAQEDFRAAMKKTHDTVDHTAEMTALKTACGDSFHGGFGMGMEGAHNGMKGPKKGMIAEKLGMTADELKTALDSGKTIEQIATEKGVTLPTRREGGKAGGRGGMMNFMHRGQGTNQK